MKRIWWLLVPAMLLAQRPAFAFVDGGVNGTFGNQDYKGTYGYLDFGGDSLHFMPSINMYDSSVSSGSFETIQGRLAYDMPQWGVGLTGGFTPTNDQYNNQFAGADASVSLTESKGPGHRLTDADRPPVGGEGLTRVDLGVGATFVRNRDGLQLGPNGSAGLIPRVGGPIVINEGDLTAKAAGSFLSTVLSGQFTHSAYDHNLTELDVRPNPDLQLAGVSAITQGYRKNSTNLKLSWEELFLMRPYISYTYTTYEAGLAPSRSFDAGIDIGLQMLSVKVAYEHIVQSGISGNSSTNYATVGAGLRF